jgi:tetratricopeptide (TPR) repeat protein
MDSAPDTDLLLPEGQSLTAQDVIAIRASSMHRLALLFARAEGAWAIGVYGRADLVPEFNDDLRQVIAPIPVYEVSLDAHNPSLLAALRTLPDPSPAPVVAFTGIGTHISRLSHYLDVQRDALARLPHRLLLWVSDSERKTIMEQAPNFTSRVSGVFYFPVLPSAAPAPAPRAPDRTTMTGGMARGRPLVEVQDERKRESLIRYYRDRIEELRRLPRSDHTAIADSLYDLAGLLETSMPPQWAEAEKLYIEAANEYARAGLNRREAESQLLAGLAASRNYAHAPALHHLEAALQIYRLLGDRLGEANVLQAQGDVLYFLKQTDDALARYDQALQLFRAVGDRLGEANVLQAQGDVLAFLDQRTDALARYDQALQLFRAVGARLGEANALIGKGRVALASDQPEEADRLLAQAVALYKAIGDRYSVAAQTGNYGYALLRHGQPEAAHSYVIRAAALFDQIQMPDFADRQRAALLAAYQQSGDWERVRQLAGELMALGRADAGVWSALGDARSNLEDQAGAAEAYAQAVELAPGEAMIRRNYADVLIRLNRLDEAEAQLKQAGQLDAAAPYLALRWAQLARARDDRAEAIHWASEALARRPDWDEPQEVLRWAEGTEQGS